MNKHETAEILGYLSAAYPNAKVTKETAIVFHDMLKELAQDRVYEAAKEMVRESDFFPSPAQLLKSVARSQGLLSPSATVAWQDVLRQVQINGTRSIPQFAHDTTAEVVKAVGWRDICMSENVDVLRSNFLRMYKDMAVDIDRMRLAEAFVSAPNALEGQKALSEGSEG